MNNGYHAATLIVLDPDTFGGASVETVPGYQLLGFAKGVERARTLFPRSCMNQLLEPYGYVANLWVRQGTVTVDVWDRLAPIYSSLHYQFDKGLRLRSVSLSDAFLAQHHQLEAARQLDHRFSPAEEDTLHHLTYLRSFTNP